MNRNSSLSLKNIPNQNSCFSTVNVYCFEVRRFERTLQLEAIKPKLDLAVILSLRLSNIYPKVTKITFRSFICEFFSRHYRQHFIDKPTYSAMVFLLS